MKRLCGEVYSIDIIATTMQSGLFLLGTKQQKFVGSRCKPDVDGIT
jgi:hypothetical protein